jgi:antitoxin component YwqK of YwqJK toxin-antitoxin module
MSEINDDFCGVVRTYYDEEKTKIFEEYFKMNGKIEGIYKSYWQNGQLFYEVNYIDDKREGIYKSYWDDGQLYKEVNYIDGKESIIVNNYTVLA